jgi:hypothetical protein
MSRFAPTAIALLGAVQALSGAAAEIESIPEDARLPLVVVEAGIPVATEEIDAFIRHLSTPVQRGENLMEQMGLLKPADPAVQVEMEEVFAEAENLFFEGYHREATAKLKRIVDWSDDHPESLLIGKAFRDIVFKSHVHLAVIALGDERLVDAHLRSAARFQELIPTPTHFPPWVCERFNAVSAHDKAKGGEVVKVAAPKGCESTIVGNTVTQFSGAGSIKPGWAVVRTTCGKREGLVQRTEISSTQTGIKPVFLKAASLEVDAKDLILKAAPTVDETAMNEDLLSLLEMSGKPRLVALIGRSQTLEARLVDYRAGRAIRTAAVKRARTGAPAEAGAAIAAGLVSTPETRPRAADRRWYRDPAAWTLVGTGAAILGVGAALFSVYGGESVQESVALGAMAGGGGLLGTGIVLFFFAPKAEAKGVGSAKRIPAVGMSKTF